MNNPLDKNDPVGRLYTEVSSIPKINPLWKMEKNNKGEDVFYIIYPNGKKEIKCTRNYSKISGPDSRYWAFYENNKKIEYRCSNHWSYYIIKNFVLHDTPVWGKDSYVAVKWGTVHALADTGQYYNLVLSQERVRELQENYENDVKEASKNERNVIKTDYGTYINLNGTKIPMLGTKMLCGKLI